MAADMVPFNIELLIPDLDLIENRLLQEIKVLDTFVGSNSKNFHSEGLFSVEIFGRVGDERRSSKFAYIDTKAPIMHPKVLNALTNSKTLYEEIISSKTNAIFDKNKMDFVRVGPLEGETGFKFFIDNLPNLVLENTNTDTRKLAIDLLQKYKDNLLFKYIMVLPAGLRDFEFTESGTPQEDEVNKLYRKTLALTNQINADNFKRYPEELNYSRYATQRSFNDIYEYFISLLDGKKKMIQGKWTSRKIHNATRNVFTSLDNPINELHDVKTISYNQSAVGLFQYLKATLPVSIYDIKNGFISKIFSGINMSINMVDKKTWKPVSVPPDEKLYNSYMTFEGLEKIISKFGIEDTNHLFLEYKGYYFGLIYKGPEGFCVFQDIGDLPQGYSRQYVSPLTIFELLYISVYKRAVGMPCTLTRYPITGKGSIWLSYVYLKSTSTGESFRELNSDFVETGSVCHEFPIYKKKAFTTLSPHYSHLKLAGADHDGDTGSLICYYTKQSKERFGKSLNKKSYYVDSSGRLSYSGMTDDISLLIKYMTRRAA